MKKLLLLLGLPFAALAQPTPLMNTWIPGITRTTIYDNRPNATRQMTNVTLACSGTGSWTASLAYGSTSSGSFTSYGSGGSISNLSSTPVAFGFLYAYPNYIRVTISGTVTCNLSGFQRLYPAGSSTGGGGAFSDLTSGTNTSAAMVVGSGATLTATGSGSIVATAVPVGGVSGLGTGVATFLATPTSANLAAAVTNETGTGALVFATGPTITLANATGLPFTALTTGTNLGNTMVIGNGSILATSGTGVILATTAAALAVNPSPCSISQYVTDIAADGTLTCAQVAYSQVSGTPTIYNQTIQDESTPLTQRSVINFTGSGVTATDSGGVTVVTIPGGGGGSTAFNDLTGGTNTSAAMIIGSGASLTTSGSGTISATSVPLAGISGFGSGMATFLSAPSSANLATTVTDETGSGLLVFGTSPTLITPALGTPSAVVLTNGTGLPISTGVSGLASGMSSFLGTPSSANLAGTVTDETGSGSLVFSNSPALTTPNLGTPSAAILTNATALPFSSLASATNTTAAMVIGTGASLATSGSGTIAATTAAALAANPSDCSSNLFANAIVANGNLTCGSASPFSLSTTLAPSHSATPTFSLADATGKSPVRIEPGAMTANITSVTFTNKSAGAKFSIAWLQDGTGGRTVSYGASATNGCQVDPTLNVTTTQQFEIASDGTTVLGVGCSTDNPNNGYFIPGTTSGGTSLVAPATGGGTATFFSGSDTVTGIAATQTLTNKTLTSPTVNNGTFDLSSGTLKVPNSTTLPGTCSVGQSYMDTDATSGSRWYLCESTNTWAVQGGSGSSKYSGSCGYRTVSMTGSDVTVCTFSSVTLSAGSCLTFSYHSQNAAAGGNSTTKIKVGATTVATFAALAQDFHLFANVSICNDASVQNAQHVVHNYGSYIASGSFAGSGAQQNNLWGGSGTASIGWSTPQTVTITESQGSGTMTTWDASLQEF